MASLLLVFLFAACASVPLPEREGVVLYRKKCGACHRPYAPTEIRAAGWDKTFAEMKNRARLTPEEIETIRRYLEPDFASAHGATLPGR